MRSPVLLPFPCDSGQPGMSPLGCLDGPIARISQAPSFPLPRRPSSLARASPLSRPFFPPARRPAWPGRAPGTWFPGPLRPNLSSPEREGRPRVLGVCEAVVLWRQVSCGPAGSEAPPVGQRRSGCLVLPTGAAAGGTSGCT